MVHVIEQGAISFIAVPRAGRDGAASAGLERFFVVLAPAGRRPLRRISIARRRLPDPGRGQRFYAHVDLIAPAPVRLAADVRVEASRGRCGAPRVLAVGRYALALHRDHVHLAYALARSCGRPQAAAALGIRAGGSFILCAFTRSLPPTRRPETTTPLAPATPERLDVIGVELAVVAGEKRRDAALGIAPGARDRVGDSLVGALLRRGPKPRVTTFVKIQA